MVWGSYETEHSATITKKTMLEEVKPGVDRLPPMTLQVVRRNEGEDLLKAIHKLLLNIWKEERLQTTGKLTTTKVYSSCRHGNIMTAYLHGF